MDKSTNKNQRIAKNSIFLSVRMLIVLCISLYTTRVVLQRLGVVDFGIYNVVCGFVAMFAFLNTSMSNGIQRFYNFEYGKNGEAGASTVFCTSVYIQFFLAIGVVLIVELFGLWYLHNRMVIPEERLLAAEWIFQLSMISFVLGVIQAPFSAAIVAHERFDFYAIVSVIEAVLKLCAVISLKYVHIDKLITYGFLITFVSFFCFLLYVLYCKINFEEIKFHRGLNKQMFKKMLGFSGWNLFGSLSGVMKEQGINLIINFFFGPVVNAARGVAAQVNSGIQGFVGNILTPVRPQVVQSYASGDTHRAMSLTYSISKFSSCFFLMMAIPASLEIDYVLKLWLGQNIPEHTNYFTILVLATTLVNILNGATSTVVHATGVMKDYQLWGSLIGISSVPLAYFVLKIFNIPELALVVVLVCTVIGHIIGLFIVRKLVAMSLKDYFMRVVLPISTVFVLSSFLVLPIHLFLNEGLLRLVLVTISSVLFISLSLYYLGLQKNEHKLLLQFIQPIINKFKR